MAFEMICGQCRGNLLVEHFGVVVACPHCGAHLHIPEAPADSTPTTPTPTPPQVTQPTPEPVTPSEPETVAVVEFPYPVPMSDDRIFEPAPPTEEMCVFTGEESEPPPSVEISVVSPVAISESATDNVSEETPAPVIDDGACSLSALITSSDSAASEPQATSAEPAPLPTESTVPPLESFEPMVASDLIHESDAVTATATEMVSSGLSGLFGSADSPPPQDETVIPVEPPVAVAETSAVTGIESPLEMKSSPHEEHLSVLASDSAVLSSPTVTKSADKDHITVSKSALLLLISYCSAITLGFIYLLYSGSANEGNYGVESLPDVLPPKRKTSGIYREATEMPEGHDLQVGDTQRFGNIEVKVLKVTRGSIQFRHFSDANKSRLPTAPVLKLWLRFKNVSTDQEIAPLDDQLLFTRGGKDRFTYRSNQFVCHASQKMNPNAKRIIAFDHIIGSGWDLANLPLDKPLQPGESYDYYVPTCENDLELLTGELVWRVHIRKGYSSRGNGVTTLFEVHFNSDVISEEAA